MPLIEVDHLQKTYYTDGVATPVLHGIDFTIERGEFVSIMGPAGSGKSTLLHILGFLDRETGGTYMFNGKKSSEYSEEDAAKLRNSELGFVFQSFNLLPRASIYENVTLPLTYSSIPQHEWDDRIVHAIESVGLTHRSVFDPAQLSGGERQRVAIARALIMQPTVIFADEPTGNLDSASGETVMKILTDLHAAGNTIILITHEPEAAAYAKRTLYIRDGRLESDKQHA
ncbi:MAG: ABC transporter ATP-binding protein [bacterium]|nr:ABC transporter ATP-binding protein [bacterium]